MVAGVAVMVGVEAVVADVLEEVGILGAPGSYRDMEWPVEIQPPQILNSKLRAHRCSRPVFHSICWNIL